MTLKRFFLAAAAIFVFLGLASSPAPAAVGCDLNDPDRDVPRLFPGATRYETLTLEIQKLGGDRLLGRIESRLRDKLRGLYETIDVPYTLYVIYRGEEKIGYIHGVTQKGRYGGIQIFLALDLDESIRTFYIQKISGPHAGRFRKPGFAEGFVSLSLADFERYEVATGQATGRVARIENPAPLAEQDFRFTLRGTKKNLILVNEFLKMSAQLAPKKGNASQ